MSSKQAIMSRWTDELARTATITMTVGTTEDGAGVDRLIDDNPAKLMKANEDQVAILIDFGSPTPVGLLALIHATLESTDDVRIQANATDSWGSPSFDKAFPQAGWLGSGSTRWPLNSWFNLADDASFSPAGYRYIRLTFGLTTPLAQALQIGQLRIHPRSLYRVWVDVEPQDGLEKPIIENTTAFKVFTGYTRGTTLWGMAFALSIVGPTAQAELDAHWMDVDGRAQPWIWIPNGQVNHVRLVRYTESTRKVKRTTPDGGLTQWATAVEELARGLRPGV